MTYKDFIKTKQIRAMPSGFSVDKECLNKNAFEWQKDIVVWALKKGRCALFEDCGLGKTLQQLMFASEVVKQTKMPVMIFAPLSVVQQTVKEGEKFGEKVLAVREQSEIKGADVYIANYDIASHFNLNNFSGVVLDESSILKDFSSKTRQLLMDLCKNVSFKLCCTATPSPNDYTELGNHAEFLGIMSRTEMLATFFVHDGGNTSSWRLKGHAKQPFFEWVGSWACCMTNPEDLGYSGEGYHLPELRVHEQVVKTGEMKDTNGQLMFFAPLVQTLSERRASRRNSLNKRAIAAAEIANQTDEQCLVWCDLNDESALLKEKITDCVEVKGTDTPDYKVDAMQKFTDKTVKCLVSKPSIAGWGMNWQQCHKIIFVGLSDSFEAYYQAIRRCFRFGQKYPVDVYIVISDSDVAVKANIERKQREAQELTRELVKYTKDILKEEIKSTCRTTESYQALESMMIPEWIGGAA